MMDFIAKLKTRLMSYVNFNRLNRDTKNPRKTQNELLLNILNTNKNTEFGQRYNFAQITSYEVFKQKVPIHTYEMLQPYIDKQIETNGNVLTTAMPVMYTQTSGTSGAAKYIPILEETIASYKQAQELFSYAQCRDIPDIFSGKILAIVSPAIEGYLSNGVPYGSMSGIVYKNMPASVRSKYILPPEIFEIADYEIKYLLIVAFALLEENITVLASANPSTFLRLEEVIRSHAEQLIAFVATGNIDALGVAFDQSIRQALGSNCKGNSKRAEKIKIILSENNPQLFSKLWINMKAVITWTSGNCALLIPRLKRLLVPDVAIIEMGYLCSEFRGTITIDCIHNKQVPAIDSVFFEFIEIAQWQNNVENTVTIEQLEMSKQYYVIATVAHGLYRYFINDIIEVTGRYGNTPTIAFLQKGKGVTNLTGEKLYESQVIEAVKTTCEKLMIESKFFMMLADQEHFTYTLYMEVERNKLPEEFRGIFESTLSQLNIEYLAKTKSGRIKLDAIKQLKTGCADFFKRHCVHAGQREGQFKVIKLQYRGDVSFPFDEYVEI